MTNFEKARDEARKTNHALWCGFLNDNPDNASCPQSPSEVYSEAFEAGADWAHEWTLQLRDDMRDDLRAEIERLKAELAKREGELHMNSDFNVEKLHMNSKGEPAKCEPDFKNDQVLRDHMRSTSAEGARKPLVGYMIMEDYAEDYSHWNGVIGFPDPTGANLAWESPVAMIEKSAYDALKAERDRLLDREKGEG